jgi:hypothetical protein
MSCKPRVGGRRYGTRGSPGHATGLVRLCLGIDNFEISVSVARDRSLHGCANKSGRGCDIGMACRTIYTVSAADADQPPALNQRVVWFRRNNDYQDIGGDLAFQHGKSSVCTA